MGKLDLRRRGRGEDRIGTRIECLRYALDASALTCSIPSLIHDHHRHPMDVHLKLELVQYLLLFLELTLVIFAA